MLSKPQKLTVGLLVVVFVLLGGLVAFFRFAGGSSNITEGQTLGDQISVPATPEPTQTPIIIPPQNQPVNPAKPKSQATTKPTATTTPSSSASATPAPTPTPTPQPTSDPTPSPTPTPSPEPSPSPSPTPTSSSPKVT